MRDGTRLFAVALVPKGQADSLPIILIRTPFNAAREFSSATLPPQLKELAADGYIFVDQDIRGRFGSGGEFVTLRPQAVSGDPKGVDESTDAWDTIDWLVKNLPKNNGKVGVIGISYRGWLAGLAGVNPHPALKAISPQAPVTDAWMGDDFFHQGAFRQTQAAAVAAYIESDKGFSIPLPDQYDFYLGFPTLDSLARGIGVSDRPTWSGAVAHPAWDGYWQARAMQNVLTRPAVPTLFVGGFWDEEDILGPQLAYRTVE
jgi:putative CocE/NonD family hydrolase